MRKFTSLVFMCGLIGLLGNVTPAGEAQLMYVQVREAPVRATPSFLGKIVAKVAFSGQVEILESKGDWFHVRAADGADGWMHTSSVNNKPFALKSGDASQQGKAVQVSFDEAELAGKGMEAAYKQKYALADYAVVDQMEKFVVSQQQIAQFVKAGGLTVEGGAQ